MKASSRRSLVRGMRCDKKLEDIPNGGPVSLMTYAKRRSCTVKAGESSPQGSESFGGHGRVRNIIRISGGDQRSGSKVQVEVGVDADERSEKLVRNTDAVLEDGELVLLKVIRQDEQGTAGKWTNMV